MTTSHRRALLAGGLAVALARPATAFPVRLPFGGKRKPDAPAVDLAGLLRETGAPSLACAVVTPEGLVYLDAAGQRRVEGEATVSRDDPFPLLANTQALTSALFARHVQSGEATWGARLPALFPDLAVDPGWSEARLVDVLSHRAGITDAGFIDGDWLAAAAADATPPREQRSAVAKALLAAPPARLPGGFEYAGLNYVLAGAALERLSGRPFEAAMRAELFDRMGMGPLAGFGAPAGPRAPSGHVDDGSGRLRPLAAGAGAAPAVLNPSAGASMPLADYARFLRLFLTGGGDLFTDDTLNRLGRPWGGADGEVGLGWQVWRERGWAKGPVLEHEGSDGGWHVLAQVAPARGLALVAASNADALGGGEGVRRAVQALVKAYA